MLKTTVRVGVPQHEDDPGMAGGGGVRWIAYIRNVGLEQVKAAIKGRGLGFHGSDMGVVAEIYKEPKFITIEAFKQMHPRKDEKGPSLAKTVPTAAKTAAKKPKRKVKR